MKEKHSDHKTAGFFSSKVGLWVSPNGKEAKILDFIDISSRIRNTITLKCNLSNHGCKEVRRVMVEVKVKKMWTPKIKKSI